MLALAQMSQEEVRHQILHTWESRDSWRIPIEVFGIDISINKAVWFLFAGSMLTFIVMFIGSRILKDRPGAYQVIVEEIYGFGRNFIAGQLGEEGKKFFPYTLSLFIFILILNLIGLFPNSFPVTSSISFTLTLALLTFIITQFMGFKRHGVRGYIGSFVMTDLPARPIMVPFMFVTEMIQEFTKPLTLGLRLYANILAGHLIIFVFLSFILLFGAIMIPVSVPLAIGFYGFELFVAVLQAYIFAILTQVYIELAMFAGENH